MRVYELAKTLNLDSRRLIDLLRRLNVDVRNHMSTLEQAVIDRVTDIVQGRAKETLVPPAPPRPRQTPPPARPAGPAVRPEAGSGAPPVRRDGPAGPLPEAEARSSGPVRTGPRPGGPSPVGPGAPGMQGPRPVGPADHRGAVPNAGPAAPRPSGGPIRQPAGGPRPFGAGPRPQTGGPRPPGATRPPGGGMRPQGGGPARPSTGPIRAGAARPASTTTAGTATATQKPAPRRSDRDRKGPWREGKGREEKLVRNAPRSRETVSFRTDRPLVLEGPLTVLELAKKMAVPVSELIKRMIPMGIMAAMNQELDIETAVLIGEEIGYTIQVKEAPLTAEQEIEREEPDRPEDLEPRAPVVTVMGHVDHGKTSLLDALRETNVTAQEAGGITQHIGAHTVMAGGKRIVFLDTPGHEAFTAMRARGAKITDIAILVVAADDGVMPQTQEAINHAKAAEVPILVAINKMDKPGANPERVQQQLTEYGLLSEAWGGDTIMAPVSAKSRMGLDHLLEMILLMADMRELKANPGRRAQGTVIEAKLDKGRGPVATVLIQNGSLEVGDPFVVGRTWGRVRAMVDDRGRRLKKALPATPVEVLGLTDVPEAGDAFIAVADEKKAREVAETRQARIREAGLRGPVRGNLEDLFQRIRDGETQTLALVVKGDVQGSVEAVTSSLERLSNDEVRVRILHEGVGGITESDVMLAAASGAIIIGFNVRPDSGARRLAERERVDVRTYRVIYEAIDEVKAAITGMLKPVYKERIIGRSEVRATFRLPKGNMIAGLYVTEGKVSRSGLVRVIRNGVVVLEGKVDSLRHFKEDVREMAAGYECGLGIERFNDIKEGDQIECYVMEEESKGA